LTPRSYCGGSSASARGLEARFVLEDKLILLVLDAARVKHPA
ncbi:hypothetical protein ACUOCP_00105, partial [Escherichia sp. R-CC3]